MIATAGQPIVRPAFASFNSVDLSLTSMSRCYESSEKLLQFPTCSDSPACFGAT